MSRPSLLLHLLLAAAAAGCSDAPPEGAAHPTVPPDGAAGDGGESRGAADAAGGERHAPRFAYASSPEDAGEIRARDHVQDLDLHQVELANGVRVWIKRTDFLEGQILFQALLGGGKLAVEPERHAVAVAADAVFGRSGLEAHGAEDLRRLRSGRRAVVGATLGEDALVLGGTTTAADLLFQCELAAAYVRHPGWREEGMAPFRQGLEARYDALGRQLAGPVVLEFLPAVLGGDPRFTFDHPPREELEAVRLEDVRRWMEPELASAPLSIYLVGDLDVKDALAAVTRTFGALAPRRAHEAYFAALGGRRVTPGVRSGVRMEREVETDDGRSLVVVVFPSTDGMQAEVRRQLSFLAQVAKERLRSAAGDRRIEVRAPAVRSEASTTFPGVGLLLMQGLCTPEDADELVQLCLDVARGLAGEGVAAEDVEPLRGSLLAQLERDLRNNGFWTQQLAETHARGSSALDDLRSLEEDLRDLRPADLGALAQRHLVPDRASVLVVHPAGWSDPSEGPANDD